MLKKWSGYLFLSLLSFGFFTSIFHTVANAEASPNILQKILPSPQPEADQPLAETPTITPTPTNTPTPTPTNTPTPTPTETPARNASASVAGEPTPTPQPEADQPLAETTIPTDTPTPTPTPEQAPQPNGTDLDRWFDQYASQYAIDRTLLHKIAQCESGFNTNANFRDMYVGMYQFGEQTWISTRTAMGADPNPALRTNAEESIKTAAFKISQGGAGAWPNCL